MRWWEVTAFAFFLAIPIDCFTPSALLTSDCINCLNNNCGGALTPATLALWDVCTVTPAVSYQHWSMPCCQCSTFWAPMCPNPCQAGAYMQGVNCTLCPLGTYLPTFSYGNSACLNCNAGAYTSQLGSTACILCSVGSYVESVNSTSCKNCQPGTYSDQPQNAACLPCPNGSYVDSRFSSCITCTPGFYLPQQTQTLFSVSLLNIHRR